MLDGVINHVGAEHPLFRSALQAESHSPESEFFRIDWTEPSGAKAANFEGHDSLIVLNHSSPSVVEYVVQAIRHWLSRGVDGWRLDAAYATAPQFWSSVLREVRKTHPQAFFVGEVMHGDYAASAEASSVDSVTQYELWKAAWSSLSDRNFFELDWALARHNTFLDRFLPMTFVGNHDVSRIFSMLDASTAILALVVLMTIGGVPSIYYGDEQGFTGLKEQRVGGDDEVRPAFPDKPDQLADWGAWIFRIHQELISLRLRYPRLARAKTEKLELSNSHYVYVARGQSPMDALTVRLDLADAPRASIQDSLGVVLFLHG
jgi:cyclomaltodextrinase / maltogenic alpha-amylase / neopullulanase